MPHADFKFNVNHESASLLHFWGHTVGSSYATVALRADWQKQLIRCNRQPGFVTARKTWTDMGGTGSLAANEVSALELASAILMQLFATRQEEGSVFVELTASKTLQKWNL